MNRNSPGAGEPPPARAPPLGARLSPTARLLIACRGVRAIGQGALVVDFALYLAALHWSAFDMGLVYAAGLLLNAAVTLIAGPLSDRVGRRAFLIGYDVTQVFAGLAAFMSSAPAAIVPAAILGSFGRGANGAAGPFSPVEQAWLSAGLAPSDYGPVYSLNVAVGFCGQAIGCGCAALPPLWRAALPGATAYRPLFLLVFIGALVSLALLVRMKDVRGPVRSPREEEAPKDQQKAAASERGLLLRLVGINAVNGLGIGIIGPFMALWFALRFGAGPAAIAPVLGLGFVLAMVSALLTGKLTRRLGMVRSVVVMRTAGLVLLVLLPFAPTYFLAAACYVLRSACNRGTAGARQAVGLRLVGAERRGLAASLNSGSMQIPRALGPTLGGLLLDSHMLALPLLLAAALQGAYIVLYRTAFRSVG